MAQEHYYTKAVWSDSSDDKTYPGLVEDTRVDVAIVGAGITGLSAAYLLAKAGKKVAVLEEKQVGMGTTGSSTGNLYAPIDERLHSIQSKHNDETMKAVAASRMAAIDFIENRVTEYAIDCNFKRVPFYLFTTPDTSSQNSQVEKEYKAAELAGLKARNTAPAGFPFQAASITGIEQQAQFDPLAYVRKLAASVFSENCQIYENTKVTSVEDGNPCIVHTQNAKVEADKVIMATHSPKGIYGVHTAMEPYREYAVAARLKGKVPEPGVYWHVQEGPQYSVRPYTTERGNYLLVLGEPYKVGNKNHSEENFKKIEAYMRRHFEVDSIEYTWAAQNYKPADNLPYIGSSPLEKNTYIATGFAADGLVYGTLSGMIISDTILGKDNSYAKIYDPKRFTPVASAPSFIKENATVAANLLKDYLFYGDADELKEIKPGEGKTIKLEGERLAAYRNEEGKLHIVSAICPHMGCVVHWNNGEKSWDCPCHGSRFAVDGELLEGPAFHGLAKPSGGDASQKNSAE